MKGHSNKAAHFLKDKERAGWHDETLWMVRQKRDKAVQRVSEWEEMREQASLIKASVLSSLDQYLLRFEENAIKNGAQVLWASNDVEFNQIILGILREYKATKIVKSKSMLTEECGMNHFLEKMGIEVVDTDLGERIIQLRKEPPSHIVLPAIHLKKEEIGELFHDKLHSEKGNSDPAYLTGVARQHLRTKFLEAEVAITGVNFAVAETGSVVVCTNEGNADMGVQAAPVQIHCMGIEKIIPRMEDLGLFTRLLARSATGQPITTYTSYYRKPKPGGQMYVVIVDNGRSGQLGSDSHRDSLKCIRCGACLNTCPVYRWSGGKSYDHTIPGPIGSILAPHTHLKKNRDLPFASTLCGSCTNICPVKIDIHKQLYTWRQEISESIRPSLLKKTILKIASKALADGKRYDMTGRIMRWSLKNLPRFLIYNRLNTWGRKREFPEIPAKSFKQWYHMNYPLKKDPHGQG